MAMATLKDLKLALENIPEEVLDKFGAGFNVEGDSDTIELLCWSDGDPHAEHRKALELFPELKDINDWIRAIIKVQHEYDDAPDNAQEDFFNRENPIDSTEA